MSFSSCQRFLFSVCFRLDISSKYCLSSEKNYDVSMAKLLSEFYWRSKSTVFLQKIVVSVWLSRSVLSEVVFYF
jgi:hypothetical protein